MPCWKLETVGMKIFDGDIVIVFVLNISSCVLWSFQIQFNGAEFC
jgi:hypothetical protein